MADGPRTHARTAVGVSVLATAVAWTWLRWLPPRSSPATVDLYFLFFPAHHRFGAALARGSLPLWNGDLGLGINEMADSQYGFFYPPNLLFALLPTAWALDVLAWFHFVLAASAAFLLCTRSGLAASSAACAAVALACGMALHALAGWTPILATFAWCPVALLAARHLAEAPRLGSAVVLAVVLGLQLLAGYLQFSLYTMVLLLLFLRPAAGSTHAPLHRTLGWTALAAVLGLGIAAMGVFPALAAVPGSVRERANIPHWFYEVVPVQLAAYRRGLAAPALDGRLPVYAGVLVPLLALGGLSARGLAPSVRLPALLLTGGAIVLSLGSQTFVFPLLWKLPIGHWLTHPHKWAYFFALGLALLAAVGAEAARRGVGIAARAAWLVLGIGLLALVPFPLHARVGGFILLLVLTLAAERTRRRAALALPVLVVLTILPAYREHAQRPSDNLNYFVRYEDAYAYLASRRDEGRTFILTPDLYGSPRQGEIAGVPQVTTNGTFLSERLDRYMRATREAAAHGAHKRAIGLLRAAGSRFVMTGRDQHGWLAETGAKRVFTGGAGDVWEDPVALPRTYLARRIETAPAAHVLDAIADPVLAADRAVVLEQEDGAVVGKPVAAGATAGGARIVAATDDVVRIEVDAPAPAVLVLLDAWSPEWRATVDGRPAAIRRANLVARAVELPAGAHEVVFRFVPTSFYAGATTSAATVLAIALALVITRRRGR